MTADRDEMKALYDAASAVASATADGLTREQIERVRHHYDNCTDVVKVCNMALRSLGVAQGEWKSPIDTVGKLADNLRILPYDMPLCTAYFVEIGGVKVAKTINPSLSGETVSEHRIQNFEKDGPKTLVIWAHQDERSAAPQPDEAPSGWKLIEASLPGKDRYIHVWHEAYPDQVAQARILDNELCYEDGELWEQMRPSHWIEQPTAPLSAAPQLDSVQSNPPSIRDLVRDAKIDRDATPVDYRIGERRKTAPFVHIGPYKRRRGLDRRHGAIDTRGRHKTDSGRACTNGKGCQNGVMCLRAGECLFPQAPSDSGKGETPRVDREEYTVTKADIGFKVVNPALARILERELADAKAAQREAENLHSREIARIAMENSDALGLPRQMLESLSTWMIRLGFATGHGDSFGDLLGQLEKQVIELRAQLPASMQNCTIVFKECEKGHGRLTATNWIDNGCQPCAIDELRGRK